MSGRSGFGGVGRPRHPSRESIFDLRRCMLFFAQDDAPLLLMFCEHQSMQCHHLADDIVDRGKHFDGFPTEFAQPEFIQDSSQPKNQPFDLRMLPEKRGGPRAMVLQLELQSIQMTQEISRADEDISEYLLYLPKRLRSVPIAPVRRDSVLAHSEAALQSAAENPFKLLQG